MSTFARQMVDTDKGARSQTRGRRRMHYSTAGMQVMRFCENGHQRGRGCVAEFVRAIGERSQPLRAVQECSKYWTRRVSQTQYSGSMELHQEFCCASVVMFHGLGLLAAGLRTGSTVGRPRFPTLAVQSSHLPT